jgi:hypothetical protein
MNSVLQLMNQSETLSEMVAFNGNDVIDIRRKNSAKFPFDASLGESFPLSITIEGY